MTELQEETRDLLFATSILFSIASIYIYLVATMDST